MIPMFWGFLALAIGFAADQWLVLVSAPRRHLRRNAWPRLAVRLAAMVLSAAVTWWLLDVPGALRLVSAINTMDEAAILASEPSPVVNLTPFGLLLFGTAVFLSMGLYALLFRSRYALGVCDEPPPSPACLRKARAHGVIWVVFAAALAAVALVALPAHG